MTFGALLGVAAALALVLGVLAVALRGLRRFSGVGASSGSRLPMEVLHRLSLAPRQGLAVVRIGERAVVVSIGDGGVRPVTDLTPAECALLRDTDPKVRPIALRASGDDLWQRLRTSFRTRHSMAPGWLLPLPWLARLLRGARPLISLVIALAWLAALAPRPASAQTTGTSTTAAPAGTATTPANAAQAAGSAAAQVAAGAAAAGLNNGAMPHMSLQVGNGSDSDLHITGTVGAVIMVGLMAMLPTLLLLMTSFTRILIVLHFVKQALGTQTAPPGHLLAALALLLTGFVMAPTLNRVNEVAVQPWMSGELDEGQMLKAGIVPFREFMLRQTPEEDIAKFVEMSETPLPDTPEEVSTPVLMSAFATSELRAAFQMGFALFLPFIVIDLVVSAVLTSMGMFMLPPTLIALPCKLLLFVLVDGWTLIIQSLVASFH